MKVVGYSALIKENKVNLNDLKVAQSEIISLKRQIENEKMSRRVDSISTKMQSHFQDILTEVTDEAEVALSAMAEDVKRVKKEKIKNVPVVKPLASTDEASSHMQVKRSKVPANFVENLAS
jgi:hypothetical protein